MYGTPAIKSQSSSDFHEAFTVKSMRCMPKVLWIFIFSYFNRPQQMRKASLVCKHWKVIIEDDRVWINLIKKMWPFLSSYEFNQPKMFVRTQLRLTSRLFDKKFVFTTISRELSKQELSNNISISPSCFSALSPTPISNNQHGCFLCDETERYFLRYSFHKHSFTLKRCRIDGSNEVKVLSSTLDLSFLKADSIEDLCIKKIKSFVDIFIMQAGYKACYKEPYNYINTEPTVISGNLFILVHKSSLSFIAHVENRGGIISDYGLTEDGKLFVYGEKNNTSVGIYDLLGPKDSLCRIL